MRAATVEVLTTNPQETFTLVHWSFASLNQLTHFEGILKTRHGRYVFSCFPSESSHCKAFHKNGPRLAISCSVVQCLSAFGTFGFRCRFTGSSGTWEPSTPLVTFPCADFKTWTCSFVVSKCPSNYVISISHTWTSINAEVARKQNMQHQSKRLQRKATAKSSAVPEGLSCQNWKKQETEEISDILGPNSHIDLVMSYLLVDTWAYSLTSL